MTKPMNVVVTGGTGFIGRHLVPLLLQRNHRVMVMGRVDREGLRHPQLSFVECDLQKIGPASTQAVREFQPDGCLHLAWQGIPDYTLENCHRNFDASIQLFQLLLKSGCKKIVGAGSCWEYGELRGKVREDQQAKNLSVFAAYKTATRLVLESLCVAAEARAVWARIFFVYGPGQRSEALIPSSMRKIRDQIKIEIRQPNTQNDFVFVGDVARALSGLLDSSEAQGIYNIGSGIPHRVGELVQDIYATLGSQETFSFVREDRPEDSFWADTKRLEQEVGIRPEIDLKTGLKIVKES